jgi:molybdopterin synthase sulfur carrier subunit
MIRVLIPYHLRVLAKVDGELQLEVPLPATIGAVLDAIEERFPALQGAIRDHQSKARRPFIRYFVCEQDWSIEVISGAEPFWIVGAIAGG